MTDQKPANVTEEDWSQTPIAVQTILTQSINRIRQLEARMHSWRSDSRQNQDDFSQGDLQANDESSAGHLLVVDDNEMNRDMLSRRLKRQGHTVETAENGYQALGMLMSEKFDLVLLDIMMPEMNGYEMLERMKSTPSSAHIPVIMISAVDEIDSIVRCIELGAEDYLSKPFNGTLLRARIGASLEKKRLRDRQAAYMRQLDIENQRTSTELEQARRIQLSMLPASPPTLPHLDIAAYQETASEVGGDYYDFTHLSDNKLLVTIGDATGHGVGSGLLVAMTKASLLATNETDLMTLIRKINNILSQIDLGVQLNMALMLVEISEMQNESILVRACGGGMPPIYVLRDNKILEETVIGGLPLAITDEAVYQITEFSLISGDIMLLMSDGLSEMFNPHLEILTFDRLVEALSKIDTAHLGVEDILKQMAEIGHRWAKGQPIHDDVTLMAIRVK